MGKKSAIAMMIFFGGAFVVATIVALILPHFLG
jgi:hypothetical protein